MGPHAKTVITLAGAATFIVALFAVPLFAKVVYGLLWFLLVVALFVGLYIGLYESYQPEEPVREVEDGFDPVI
jgi:hypothetical protein